MLDTRGEFIILTDDNIALIIKTVWNLSHHFTPSSKQNAGPGVFKLLAAVEIDLSDERYKQT